MNTKSILNTVAFVFFLCGFVSLVLLLIGAKLYFLQWIDMWGSLTGFIIRISFIVVALVLVVIVNTDFSGQEEEFDYLDKK